MDDSQPKLSILQPGGGAGPTPAGQVFNQPASWATGTLWHFCFIPWGPREGGNRMYSHPHSQDRKYRSATESRGIQGRAQEMWQPGWWPRVSKGQERRAYGKRRKGKGDFGHLHHGSLRENRSQEKKERMNEWINEWIIPGRARLSAGLVQSSEELRCPSDLIFLPRGSTIQTKEMNNPSCLELFLCNPKAVRDWRDCSLSG